MPPMNPDHSLFTAALGLQPPWKVISVDFDAEAKRIDIEVGFARGARFDCPECGATGQPVHDTRRRSWQHLHFFEHRAYIHASVPQVCCWACPKSVQVPVPWARPGSGFTQLFEALVVTLCAQMPVQAVARHLGGGGVHRHVQGLYRRGRQAPAGGGNHLRWLPCHPTGQ